MKPIALVLMSLSLSACTTSAFLENALAVATGLGGNAHSTPSKMVQPTSTSTSTSNTDDICKPTEVKVIIHKDKGTEQYSCMNKSDATTNTQPNPFHEEDTEKATLTIPAEQQPITKAQSTPPKSPKAKTAKVATTPKAKAPAKKAKTETKYTMPKGKVTCGSFSSHAQAQAYFKARKPGWRKLDRDGDSIACESL